MGWGKGGEGSGESCYVGVWRKRLFAGGRVIGRLVDWVFYTSRCRANVSFSGRFGGFYGVVGG